METNEKKDCESFIKVQPDMDTLSQMIKEAWDAHIQKKKKKGKK